MINSIDTEDTFNNDIIHNLNNCKLDMKQYLHIINITHDKCTANILNEEKLQAFAVRSGSKQEFYFLRPLAKATGKQRNKGARFRKQEVQFFCLQVTRCTHRGTRRPPKKLPESAEHKTTHKSQYCFCTSIGILLRKKKTFKNNLTHNSYQKN